MRLLARAGRGVGIVAWGRLGVGSLSTGVLAQKGAPPPSIVLHHAHLNTADPEAAIAWSRRVWPQGRAGTMAGRPAFLAEMPLLFERVDAPPPGA